MGWAHVGTVGEARLVAPARLGPAPRELEVLVNGFRFYQDKFLTDRKAAEEYLKHGEKARDASLDASEAAAYAAIASLLLNLDETVTKG